MDPTCHRKIRQVASRCGMRTHAISIRRGVGRTTTPRAEIEWRRIPCREPRGKEQLKNKTKPWNHIRSYKTSDERKDWEGSGGEGRVDRYHGRELRGRRGAGGGQRVVKSSWLPQVAFIAKGGAAAGGEGARRGEKLPPERRSGCRRVWSSREGMVDGSGRGCRELDATTEQARTARMMVRPHGGESVISRRGAHVRRRGSERDLAMRSSAGSRASVRNE